MSPVNYALPEGSRPIPDAPGYRITDVGVVWSNRPRNGRGGPISWHVMKPRKPNRDGHIRITLKVDGKKRHPYVHQLVLRAFVGPCPPGLETCHNDGNPANNSIKNLRYGTKKENSADSKRHGTSNTGERNASAKLKESDIPDIFRLWREGRKKYEIAKIYNVRDTLISRITLRQIWSHVPV